MSESPKDIIASAYDHLADWYLDWVKKDHSPRERYTEKLLTSCRPTTSPPRILELGCGPGIPVTQLLLHRGAQVTANDISSKQILMAKERCPGATYLPGDMMNLEFKPESFDGVTCFYTIFHLPRGEQKEMMGKIYTWLRPGGSFIFNLVESIDEAEIFGEMMGHGMFWSSFGVEESQAMVEDVGFEVVEKEMVESGGGNLEETDPDYGVKFVWIVARK
jgi:ubiquinone/menaquinone biosynthesis C-methylase UbiE